jgi:hypothetical protein
MFAPNNSNHVKLIRAPLDRKTVDMTFLFVVRSYGNSYFGAVCVGLPINTASSPLAYQFGLFGT